MFTLEQIKAAHSKVKSGAEFPAYIQEIKALGVTHYEAYVSDGHIDYYGTNQYSTNEPATYDPIEIAASLNMEVFKAELLAHQQGKTNYPTFIKMCAENGIEKWVVALDNMTCTYFDLQGNEVLTELIPQ